MPTVVNLWASWCEPCRTELPAFQRLYATSRGRVRVLGVATEDSAGAALALAADLGLRFPSTVDSTGRLLRGVGRAALPVTVFVTAAGRVASIYNGQPLTDATLRAQLAGLLGLRLDG